MKRYTKKYDRMIEEFSNDFWLVAEGYEKLTDMQIMIEGNEKRIIDDIELLGELAYKIRNGIVKIVEDVENAKT